MPVVARCYSFQSVAWLVNWHNRRPITYDGWVEEATRFKTKIWMWKLTHKMSILNLIYLQCMVGRISFWGNITNVSNLYKHLFLNILGWKWTDRPWCYILWMKGCAQKLKFSCTLLRFTRFTPFFFLVSS